MMTIFGTPRAREGHILFEGRDITQLPTHEIAKLHIAQAPEGRRIFSRMTVMENLQMGASVADACAFWRGLGARVPPVPTLARALCTSAAARCRAASSKCWRSAAR